MTSDNEIPSAPDNARRRFRLSVLEKLLLIVIVIGLAMMFKVLLSSGAGIDPGTYETLAKLELKVRELSSEIEGVEASQGGGHANRSDRQGISDLIEKVNRFTQTKSSADQLSARVDNIEKKGERVVSEILRRLDALEKKVDQLAREKGVGPPRKP